VCVYIVTLQVFYTLHSEWHMYKWQYTMCPLVNAYTMHYVTTGTSVHKHTHVLNTHPHCTKQTSALHAYCTLVLLAIYVTNEKVTLLEYVRCNKVMVSDYKSFNVSWHETCQYWM